MDSGRATAESRVTMLSILHEFGCGIYVENSNKPTMLDLLRSSRRSSFPSKRQAHEALLAHVQSLVCKPRSLQSTCRLVLRRSLGHEQYLHKLSHLKFPAYNRRVLESRLKPYLNYHDL